MVYICDMDISCCLPNLAFHTPMLALLYFCRVHSSKMGANHVESRKCSLNVWVDSFLHLDSQLTNIHLLAEPFWRIITNPVVVQLSAWGSSLSLWLCVCSIFFWKRLIQSQRLWQQAPKEPRGYIDPRPMRKLKERHSETNAKRRHGSRVEIKASTRIQRLLAEPASQNFSVHLNTREGTKASPIRLWCWKFHSVAPFHLAGNNMSKICLVSPKIGRKSLTLELCWTMLHRLSGW